MSNIREVAALAGVSISTVSNVLNEKKNVSEPTRARVMDAVEQLDFRLDPAAADIRSKRSMMIGVILPSITRVFYSQVLAGMNEVAADSGYSIALYNTEYSPEKERKYIGELVRSKVDGIIVASVAPDEDTAYLEELSHLHRGSKMIPVVSIARDLTAYGISSIGWDNRAGAQMAVQSMIDKGARSIVYLSSFSQRAGTPRFEGYLAALKENGLEYDPSLCIKAEGSAWTGYSVMNRLLNDGLSFDAVFAGSDQRGIGAIKALTEHGVRIPEDVMISGFDNIFPSSLIQPSLSTVNVPKHRLGRESVMLALEVIEAGAGSQAVEPQNILLPLQLIERASTNRNTATSWELEGW